MCSLVVPAAMAVELRHNTSKSSFESNASGNKHRTCSSFVSSFHCRSPSKWNKEETEWKRVPTSERSSTLRANHLMPGKPFQSSLIPYEEEILSLRRQRPPMAFARIAEILMEKYQVPIQRAAICKFVRLRARWKKKEAQQNRAAAKTWNTALTHRSQPQSARTAPKTDAVPPNTAGTEPRRPWLGGQNEKPASRERMLTTFTPSNEYNLTRLSPEEAAAYVEQLRREREKNGG
jgi:transposase